MSRMLCGRLLPAISESLTLEIFIPISVAAPLSRPVIGLNICMYTSIYLSVYRLYMCMYMAKVRQLNG